ncbi:hypothetical protein FJ987_22235 [Mesorhizobium sp. CU2]|uniref:hypothetical protein n=1 Tax=unclassified Mesorhizobium TaxID=325217 RepID=UPI001129E1AD|nr:MULTISPECIES: hypothetical protein [unclassified Mesorhizobium]TPN83801.1 hypothetical protein FJ988_13565 [Mesorhizobium sp. CU3]TPO09897.1 hypothetical protein FJ987_22235 [Mesorhizobium sp. CU2]
MTKERSDRKSVTALRKHRNQALTCSLQGCHHHRAGLSRFCRIHADRIRDVGDPIATIPPAEELHTFSQAIERWLAKGCPPQLRSQIEQELCYQSRRFKRPESWAVSPGSLHRRITQRGRAEIVKATVAKNGSDFRDWFIRAAAVEGWALLHFDGLPEFRERFIETQVGSWATQRGTPSRKWTMPIMTKDTSTILYTPKGPRHPTVWSSHTQKLRKKVSGAVQRLLGEDAVAASKKALHLGVPLWDQPVKSRWREGFVTLLDSVKLAQQRTQTA